VFAAVRYRLSGELKRFMPYLIDGNNLMAQTVGWHRNKAAARRKLIHALTRFVALHRRKLKVVFDGVPDNEFPEALTFKSVQIFYARPGSDADSRIKEMLSRSSYKRDTIVVTSDRDLASFAKNQGSKVISSGQFRSMLEEAAATSDKVSTAAVDVEEWLDFFKIPDS